MSLAEVLEKGGGVEDDVPVQPQYLSEDENEHHRYEHLGLENICAHALDGSVSNAQYVQ